MEIVINYLLLITINAAKKGFRLKALDFSIQYRLVKALGFLRIKRL